VREVLWGSEIRFGVSRGQLCSGVVLVGESAEDLPSVATRQSEDAGGSRGLGREQEAGGCRHRRGQPRSVYRFRIRRRCCDLQFGWMSRMGQDRGSCLFACST
jgi:hypothetical protein